MNSLKEKVLRDRIERTKEIARQVREGTYIKPQIDILDSWFPPRQTIKKDPNALTFIFGAEQETVK